MPDSRHPTLLFAWECSLFRLNGEVMTKAIRGIALDQRVVSLVGRAKAAATRRLHEQFISLMQHQDCFGRKYLCVLRVLSRE